MALFGGWFCLQRTSKDILKNVSSSIAHTHSHRTFLLKYTTSQYRAKNDDVMNVFDRKTKRHQRNLTAKCSDPNIYDYVKEEIGFRMADRINDVNRKFDTAVDLGCGRGHITQHLTEDMVGMMYQVDMAEKVLEQSKVSEEVKCVKLHVDEEFLPFKDKSLDLVISSLSLHWVNNLPGTFKQIQNALKDDACFIGCMFGGDTLYELRVALQLAESERFGGIGQHVSPFVSVQDLGGLLNKAGFTMLTIDIDDLIVNYPSMFELMQDLKSMGENNASWMRRCGLSRDVLMAASAIYQDIYGGEHQEGIPATYQIIYFIGWKPDASQPKAAKRGSGQVSLQDIDKVGDIVKELDKLKHDASQDRQMDKTFQQLAEDIEKVRQRTIELSENESDKKS